MSNDNALQALKAILGGGTVAYHTIFARALGSVTAGIFLSQGYFWQYNAKYKDIYQFEGHDGKDFFQKTGAEIYEATALTDEQQLTARRILVKAGILTEKRAGIPAKNYYHININALVSAIDGYLNPALEVVEPVSVNNGTQFPGNTETGSGQTRRQASDNYGNSYIESLESNDSLESLYIQEAEKVKIQIWTAETEFVPVGTINPNNSNEDAPGPRRVPLNRYSNTPDLQTSPAQIEAQRMKKTNGRKPGSNTGGEIEKITQVVEYLNSVTGFKLKANSAAALKNIGARLKDGATVADMMRVIDRKASEWLNTEMQIYLVPDTLFNKSKFEKYMEQLEMPLLVKNQTQQHQPRRERLRMDEPDFSKHGGVQIF